MDQQHGARQSGRLEELIISDLDSTLISVTGWLEE